MEVAALVILGVVALTVPVVAVVWWLRRRKIDRGLVCWNCGADLTERPLYVDSKGRSRCPKCGNEMDVTDTYRLPQE